MKDFLLWAPPGCIMCIDIATPRRSANSYASHEFKSWEEAAQYFLDLGAPQENVTSAGSALKENGMAKLTF